MLESSCNTPSHLPPLLGCFVAPHENPLTSDLPAGSLCQGSPARWQWRKGHALAFLHPQIRMNKFMPAESKGEPEGFRLFYFLQPVRSSPSAFVPLRRHKAEHAHSVVTFRSSHPIYRSSISSLEPTSLAFRIDQCFARITYVLRRSCLVYGWNSERSPMRRACAHLSGSRMFGPSPVVY